MKKKMAVGYFLTQGNLLVVVCCCSLVLFASCLFAAQYNLVAGHDTVARETEEKMRAEGGMFRAAVRAKQVALLDQISSEGALSHGDVLVLNLFDDARYTARIDRISVSREGSVSIRGRLESFESGYILISSTAGRTMAHIRIPEKKQEFVIFYDAETGAHYLVEIDPSRKDVLPGGPPLSPPVDEEGDNQGEKF